VREAGGLGPQILAVPDWTNITPSQTRMAVQASSASFEDFSPSQTGRLTRWAGSPMSAVTVVLTVRR
jgi:hypothetical protein